MIEAMARWALKRWVRTGRTGDAAGGRLLYLDQKGEVHDLGAYTLADLSSYHDATNVAYRYASGRERGRLARVRLTSARLANAARRVSTHDN